MFGRFLLLAISIFLLASAAAGQTPRPAIRPAETRTPDKHPDDGQEISHLPDEMRAKMDIARKEEDHKKILEDVEKLSNLSGEVARGYGERKRLSSDDLKKLGTIEKLAKRVLTHAGGEEVDPKSDSTEHMLLAQAIDILSTTVANIRKEMTAETRFVVSATVIANSNQVINLSRFIRRAKKAD
ncbi:MAG TPA: hypothetical protein VI837_05635 [Blastocatellia bacterium]|nr:hypothetical protein [Blastocatellia bacterium]